MKKDAALNIAINAIQHLKKEHKDEPDKLSIWDEAIETLQSMISAIGGFRNARGVLPWKEGDELPEVMIRRLRDGR